MSIATIIGMIIIWLFGAGCAAKEVEGFLTWKGFLIGLIMIPFTCYLVFSIFDFLFWIFEQNLFEH